MNGIVMVWRAFCGMMATIFLGLAIFALTDFFVSITDSCANDRNRSYANHKGHETYEVVRDAWFSVRVTLPATVVFGALAFLSGYAAYREYK